MFVYHCHYISDLKQESRYFKLSQKDIELINPATLTCPIFRSEQDAKITKKIYYNTSIIINEQTGYNPWLATFMTMFHMSNDSHLFSSDKTNKSLPLYEAKMFSIYDHRHGLYTEEMIDSNQNDFRIIPSPSLEQKQNHSFLVTPRYYINEQAVNSKLSDKWRRNWLLCFRGISLAVNERTAIFSILPKVGVGNSAPVVLTDIQDVKLLSCLLANSCSLVFDFVARQKIGGANFNFFIVKQLPVLPPELYTPEDIKFISDRVLELVYTAWDMQPFAKDMGYDGEPFIWNPNRRALLRAELDAYYAKLYGLTRDELRYILDPADVYGADFPSETFRVLKNNEIKQFGEYRTQRLVLEAWDRMFE